MSIPILSKKPNINQELKDNLSKLDIVSSLIVMGILLDHCLKLCGLNKATKGI